MHKRGGRQIFGAMDFVDPVFADRSPKGLLSQLPDMILFFDVGGGLPENLPSELTDMVLVGP